MPDYLSSPTVQSNHFSGSAASPIILSLSSRAPIAASSSAAHANYSLATSSVSSTSSTSSSSFAPHTSNTSNPVDTPTPRSSTGSPQFHSTRSPTKERSKMDSSPNAQQSDAVMDNRDHRETSVTGGFTAVNGNSKTASPASVSTPFMGSYNLPGESRNPTVERFTPRSTATSAPAPAQSTSHAESRASEQDAKAHREGSHRTAESQAQPQATMASPVVSASGNKRKRMTGASPSDEEDDDDESEGESGFINDVQRDGGQYGHDTPQVQQQHQQQMQQQDREGRPIEETEARLVQALRPDAGQDLDEAGVKVNPSKRKRAFTNRTKTGCTTCRRRKKKCDEGKPQCQNCQRGGFVCEGYNPSRIFKRPASGPAPSPIQAKDNEGYPGHIYPRLDTAPRPPPNHFPGTPASHYPRPGFEGDDIHEPARQWGGNTTPYSGGAPRHAHTYPVERHTPVDHHGHGMNGHSRYAPTSATSNRSPRIDESFNVTPDTNHSKPIRQPPVPSYSSLNPVQQAQQALSYQPPTSTSRHSPHTSQPPHSQHVGQSPRGSRKSEKQKMVHGEEYLPSDPQLVAEREICREAVNKFNTSLNVSKEERERQLRQILDADTVARNASTPNPSNGGMMTSSRLGQRVTVEAPFKCEYGYRVTIQDDVSIDSGCQIQDCKDVRIGKGVQIGMGVTIISKTVPMSPNERMGAQGRARGVAIHIGDYSFIGAGCIIAPMWDDKEGILKIGPGAYVMPGTVVTKDVAQDSNFGVRDRDGPDHLGSTVKRGPPPSESRSNVVSNGNSNGNSNGTPNGNHGGGLRIGGGIEYH